MNSHLWVLIGSIRLSWFVMEEEEEEEEEEECTRCGVLVWWIQRGEKCGGRVSDGWVAWIRGMPDLGVSDGCKGVVGLGWVGFSFPLWAIGYW
jgi:hypothetical protein